MNLIMVHSNLGTGLSPIHNGCDNFVIQDKEVAVEETDKQDKQSEEKKVSACMITTKQKQRSM